jgi:hypothetical protein
VFGQFFRRLARQPPRLLSARAKAQSDLFTVHDQGSPHQNGLHKLPTVDDDGFDHPLRRIRHPVTALNFNCRK